MIAGKETSLSLVIVTLIFMILSSAAIKADVPTEISYQGRLADSDGNPVSDDTYFIDFKIYGSEAGNDSLWWSGFQPVAVEGGLFTYILGSSTPLPEDLFADSAPRYLGITVESDQEISPRTKIVSNAYSFQTLRADSAEYSDFSGHASDSDSLDGNGSSYYRNASNINSGTLSEARLPQEAIDSTEIENNTVTTAEIKDYTIDDTDMGFMRWGKWSGATNDIIFEIPGELQVYLQAGSDSIYVQNLSNNVKILGYAVQKNSSTHAADRLVLQNGNIEAIDAYYVANISINIVAFSGPEWSFFFKGLHWGLQGSDVVIAGYYQYFNGASLIRSQ